MKFYLASRFQNRAIMQRVASFLLAYGHEVTSSWLYEDHETDVTNTKDSPAAFETAMQDLHDISEAETFVVFNSPNGICTPSSGRHVEYGYALGSGIPAIAVGLQSSIFMSLADEQFATIQTFLDCYAPGSKFDLDEPHI